ncbi:GNAT family N-acetyltransferase [Bordetella trematum]|uniref:GNAT family N-acetyltransferase n=1 Tax=Bordetella trematum TaxID=123899 RepID=UPI001C12E8B5|nr:GNAT family N-acetyltransferase [Bordetella trematum]
MSADLPGVSLRPASLADRQMLADLALASKAVWGYDAAMLASWRAELTPRAGCIAQRPFVLAESAGRCLGFYSLQPPAGDGEGWALDNLWVAPDSIGRGLGRLLLADARALARSRGIGLLHIDADPHAEPFYLSQGARRVGAIAAPLPGQPERLRPQLILPCA